MFFFSSRRRHTRCSRDWSSDVCSSDLEELAQDALVVALERWPESGIPDNPGAWLMATAKHRAIDLFRRNKLLDRKHAELARELKTQQDLAVANFDIPWGHEISDDLLRLVFVSCHPVLSTEARVALTLRLLGGLTTREIARAFLVPEPTVAQRIVRAKRTLTEARVPFEVPRGPDLAARLSSVLEVIYLIFNEGYSATAGDDWMRPALCEDALRLGRVLAELAPQEPEVHGLVALMEIPASRLQDRKSTRLNSSHGYISYAVFCLKKKNFICMAPVPTMIILICTSSASLAEMRDPRCNTALVMSTRMAVALTTPRTDDSVAVSVHL